MLLYRTNTIKIYSTGWDAICETNKNCNVDLHSIIVIDDFVTFERCKGVNVIAHKNRGHIFYPLVRNQQGLMLVYNKTLYIYSRSEKYNWFSKIDDNTGSRSFIHNKFSGIVPGDVNDLRINIIRYLKSIGREYDPCLMKYPQKVYPEAPGVVPLNYPSRFSDIIIICKIDSSVYQ